MLENYRSPWMDADLEAFADAVRRFCKDVIEPNEMKWREQHHVDREAWLKAGELGLILPDLPEQYGGAGGSAAHAAVVIREMGYAGNSSFGYGINYLVGHYLSNYGTEAQKQRWLPGMASGEIITSIAMTEPGTGSDLQGVRTTARKRPDGKYVINGSKTFITNGQLSDMVVVVAKTGEESGAKGISLVIVETSNPGFRRGKCLDKVGQDAGDTSEMFFDHCVVEADALLGGVEGQGFFQLMGQLPYERAMIAVGAAAQMERALALTVEYVKERRAFGKTLLDFQNTRFVLADVKATVTASRAFADHIIQQWVDGKLDSSLASMGKFWLTERQGEVIDKCVQFFGGYGYMLEYPIARMYADARVQRIYGGANEIQRELVARSL
ncbi:acyl-CoA dehydrogenase [Cupriavidus necator]|uniref:Acyl-[acyl-carrier-protein] dehydrogenase MbtN n=1 Tax=Cupriavidus necator TaxID=106590 RepID=A0A1U9URE2_CUPNE|nr:acyl-CoA dehydrogenase family protein [Cupriavidus necator]AQV94705.1 acyl-CoA dehydrogenase [Cupriavidus necator]